MYVQLCNTGGTPIPFLSAGCSHRGTEVCVISTDPSDDSLIVGRVHEGESFMLCY